MDRSHPAHTGWRPRGNRSTILFVTICTKDRAPILACQDFHVALTDAWTSHSDFVVGCYTIMPDHVHFFCSPSPDCELQLKVWVERFKGASSFAWKSKPYRKVWQPDCWDRDLRSGESYAGKWEYVRANPVRHGLVTSSEEWPFQGELNRLAWLDA